jgi:hypothetical protein
MNEFIHTFSVITHMYNTQKDKLAAAVGDHFFYNSDEKHYVFSKYTTEGFRAEIKYNPSKEKKYNKNHWDCKAEIMITPAKLLYPDQPMKKLYTSHEYELACERLEIILREIELQSGVNLWSEAKIRRIDVSKDIETPSDEYSREIIRMAKKALYKTGYHLWSPTAEAVEKKDWFEEDSFFFRNHNQEVSAKVYNKLTDMQNLHYDTTGVTGLLRFELTLKRAYIRRLGLLSDEYMTMTDLPTVLSAILTSAPALMQKHIASPLWSGAMLYKDLQKKYIRIYCKSKTARRDNMMAYRKNANRYGVFEDEPTVMKHFETAGISPLYLNGDIRYIPSFGDLLSGMWDERIERFLLFH